MMLGEPRVIAISKIVLVLKKQLKCQRRSETVRVGRVSPERSELRQQSLEGCPVRVAAACREPKAERARRRVTKVTSP